jgi:hypothetical protein
MNKKSYIIIGIIALVSVLMLLFDTQAQQPLGTLQRDTLVYTIEDELIVKDGFPVFEIRVPPGYLEVQVRASITNFEPGFLLKQTSIFVLGEDGPEPDSGAYIYNYIPTGEIVNGKKQYRALNTTFLAEWDGTKWVFGFAEIESTDDVVDPWECTNLTSSISDISFSVHKEYFVYRFCTTGEPADAEWGQGSGDPDAFVYIANQAAVPGDNTEFKRVKWNSSSALADQLQPGGTPGYTVLFQPSRDILGADEWMQQNAEKLIWIYQVEDVSGKPKHPNGSDVWNIMYPSEWRKSRLLIE